jgi:hypothetical protein
MIGDKHEIALSFTFDKLHNGLSLFLPEQPELFSLLDQCQRL